jgi:hypothetical protein
MWRSYNAPRKNKGPIASVASAKRSSGGARLATSPPLQFPDCIAELQRGFLLLKAKLMMAMRALSQIRITLQFTGIWLSVCSSLVQYVR